MTNENKVSRRKFIKGAAVVAAGMTTAGLFAGSAKAAADVSDKWDKETDVVVAGAGAGGLIAALQAVKSGAKVILLEKDSIIGGNQRYAGGCDWAEFSLEERRRLDPDGDPEWQKWAVENGNVDNKWLESLGAKFATVVLKPPEHTKYFPDPKWVVNGKTWTKSAALTEFEANLIREAGAEILLETPFVKLITDSNGGVVGVKASGPKGPLTIKAKRGVVLATGGYAANPGMRMQYLGKFAGNMRLRGIETCTGDGILAGLEVGGMVNGGVGFWYGDLMPAPPAKWKPEEVQAGFSLGWASGGGIIINLDGRRFCDESSNHRDTFVMNQVEQRVFIIFDQTVRDKNKASFDNIVKGGAIVASAKTIEELAKQLQEWGGTEFPREMDPNNVIATFNEYNKAVDEKKTLALKPTRSGAIVKIATPPFYAIEAMPGMTDCLGGLVTDIKANVLDRNKKPIARLYAVGTDGARLFSYDHNGVIGALVEGRVAGKNAAAEKPWDAKV